MKVVSMQEAQDRLALHLRSFSLIFGPINVAEVALIMGNKKSFNSKASRTEL